MAHAAGPNIVVVASDDPEIVGAFPRVVELNRGRIINEIVR
jgi:ABC-type sugar transport system ATPase subunit